MKDIIIRVIMIIFMATVCIVATIVLSNIMSAALYRREIQKMDDKELGYDANDWFVLINVRWKLVGLYFGNDPVHHDKVEFDIEDDFTDTYLTNISNIDDTGVILPDTLYTILYEYDVPKITPVLFYLGDDS